MTVQDMLNQAESAKIAAENETDPYIAAEHDVRSRLWNEAADALISAQLAARDFRRKKRA
jgi:hypothetical protein